MTIYSPVSSEATAKGIAEQLEQQHKVSTDPKWPPADMVPRDGRHERTKRTSAALLQAARGIMLAGNFRPGMSEICQRAGVSLRTGFDHFRTVENLLLDVLEMDGVAESIGVLTLSRSPADIARLVVLGRA